MPRYVFNLELAGYGKDSDEAWGSAVEAFMMDPGCRPDDYFEDDEEDEQ